MSEGLRNDTRIKCGSRFSFVLIDTFLKAAPIVSSNDVDQLRAGSAGAEPGALLSGEPDTVLRV